MAPATRERKLMSDVDTTTTAPKPQRPVKRDNVQKRTSQRQRTKKDSASGVQAPRKPQATFEGLPAELRLSIYDYLSDSTMIHVHRHQEGRVRKVCTVYQNRRYCYSWTPCRMTNPKTPLLCANPKWSGMCKEEDRCTHNTHKPPKLYGYWALAASSKTIRGEALENLCSKTVISINSDELESWLEHMAKHAPRQLAQVRRITLAGPIRDPFFAQYNFHLVVNHVPKLEGFGFQCQVFENDWERRHWTSCINHGGENGGENSLKKSVLIRDLRVIHPSVDVALEAMMIRKRTRTCPYTVVGQGVYRALREGRENTEVREREAGAGEWKPGTSMYPEWEAGEVRVENEAPAELVASHGRAKWRMWWRDMGSSLA